MCWNFGICNWEKKEPSRQFHSTNPPWEEGPHQYWNFHHHQSTLDNINQVYYFFRVLFTSETIAALKKTKSVKVPFTSNQSASAQFFFMHHHPFCHHHPHRHNTRVIKQKTPQKAPTSIIFFMVSPLIYSSSPPQALNPPKFLRLPCSHPYLQRFFHNRGW